MSKQLLNHIANRKSHLAFDKKELTQAEISLLFEAARWAPSSYNEQPWRFYYASSNDYKSFNSFLSALAPANAEWAKDSSLLIISTAKKSLTLNGRENGYALHDTGLATSNLLVQAEFMGLATHVMGGFDKEKAKEMLKITDDFQVVSVIAVGYIGDISNLSESNRKRATSERVRKPYNEIVFDFSKV
jgi:nitroreductase